MKLNMQRLADTLENAGLKSKRQNPIYDYNIGSQAHKIVTVAMEKLQPGQYVKLHDLKNYIRAQLPEYTDKQITKTLYKVKNIVRYGGLWRRLS